VHYEIVLRCTIIDLTQNAGGGLRVSSQIEDIFGERKYARVLVSLKENEVSATRMKTDFRKFFVDASEWQNDRSPNSLLWKVLGQDAAASMSDQQAARSQLPQHKLRVFETLGIAIGVVDREAVQALHEHGLHDLAPVAGLELVEPVESDPVEKSHVGHSWGIERIGAPALWEKGYRGQGVIIGHIDTGVDPTHPALHGALHSFILTDPKGNIAKDTDPFDTGRHGTHTAGTIVGRPGEYGAFGMAPEAKLASAAVIEGGEVITRILMGIDWALRQGATIISASLGMKGVSPAYRVLIREIRRKQAIPVFAIGNEGPGTSRYPGNYVDVLSVGAAAQDDTIADYSSSESFGVAGKATFRHVPTLCGPGHNVISCGPGGKLVAMNGTSMAAPHIAGLAALLRSAEPNVSMADIESAIIDSCAMPNGWNPDRGGLGVPNGERALNILRGTTHE